MSGFGTNMVCLARPIWSCVMARSLPAGEFGELLLRCSRVAPAGVGCERLAETKAPGCVGLLQVLSLDQRAGMLGAEVDGELGLRILRAGHQPYPVFDLPRACAACCA
jgi:hypothetical protein